MHETSACVVLKHGAAFFELSLPVFIRRSAECVQPSISSAEGVPPLPVMIGRHATRARCQDRRVSLSSRQGAVYGELSLSLDAVPVPRNSLISVSFAESS